MRAFAATLREGMSEEEAHEELRLQGLAAGVEKLWHPSKIRFGRNTTCTFRQASDPTVRLMKGDLFFIDYGPVFQGHEGDFGETYLFQGQGHRLIEAVEAVYAATAECWRQHSLSGQALYEFAATRARALGVELDPRMAGHRIGDFPHALHHKGSLGEEARTPSAERWILEIHLIDRHQGLGAFKEDLLS